MNATYKLRTYKLRTYKLRTHILRQLTYRFRDIVCTCNMMNANDGCIGLRKGVYYALCVCGSSCFLRRCIDKVRNCGYFHIYLYLAILFNSS